MTGRRGKCIPELVPKTGHSFRERALGKLHPVLSQGLRTQFPF